MSVSALAALRASAAVLRARPIMVLSLGAAVVLSLASVCCGIGFLTAPWFLCQLLLLQLSQLRGRPISGQGRRLPAMIVMLGAVLLVSTVALLALLGTSVEPTSSRHGPPQSPGLAGLMHTGGFYAVLCSLGTLLLVLPYLYAPLVLLEGRGGLTGGLLESARMVFAGGPASRLGLSAAAHALQVAPVLAAAGLGWALDQPESVPRYILVALPVLSLSVPLGQGMIVASYLETVDSVRGLVASPEGFEVPRALSLAWAALLLTPLAVSVLVSLSLMRPVGLAHGALDGVVVDDVALTGPGDIQTVYPPATALTLLLSEAGVSVTASDGGGAGALPLRYTAPITRMRLLRLGSAYGVELHQGNRVSHTWIDRAGVRLDDGLKRRLLERFPVAILLSLLLALVMTALVSAPVLTGLGRVRRAHQLQNRAPHAVAALGAIRKRAFTRAWLGALLLSPFSLWALFWSVRAVW